MDVFRRYDAIAGLERLGDLWVLTHGGRILRCVLMTHLLGHEIRAYVADELMRSQVCRRSGEIFDVCEAWRTEAEAKGWTLEGLA